LTKLWDHQKQTSDKIFDKITIDGRAGFGDASNVGAGKTLSALAVMIKLYNYNLKNNNCYSSFLVLLPTTYLYRTWEDEVKKHTTGFHLVFQHANGKLTEDLRHNSILITTLGRMRDHPIVQKWIFVVIDECLSVQNKNALQTGEAWRQIISSQYGALLLSATFFRTRFDKLFYMLKMLRTGLPETKEYLDAILAESIVSYIPKRGTVWHTNINRFSLSKKNMKEYDLIAEEDIGSEKLFAKLLSFLNNNFDYIEAYRKVISNNEKSNRRCLIYGRSKREADLIGNEIKGVSRFPDISGKHVVISYTEGTYGLNNLVFLNTIVTNIPPPDKLPQMRGRLDRPGQTSKELYIEYLLIEKTIDEANLFRLELSNNFYNNYILPIADYYDLAVGRKKKEVIEMEIK